jgi:hypothetical protein
MCGNSARQAPHQELKKLSSTTLPRSAPRATVPPATSVSFSEGAGRPCQHVRSRLVRSAERYERPPAAQAGGWTSRGAGERSLEFGKGVGGTFVAQVDASEAFMRRRPVGTGCLCGSKRLNRLNAAIRFFVPAGEAFSASQPLKK